MKERSKANVTSPQLNALERKPEVMKYENDEGQALFTLGETAKLLNLGMGRTAFMAKLKEYRLLVSRNEPSQSMINRGYMTYKLKNIGIKKNLRVYIPVTLVTIEGLAFLKKFIHRKLKDQANGEQK